MIKRIKLLFSKNITFLIISNIDEKVKQFSMRKIALSFSVFALTTLLLITSVYIITIAKQNKYLTTQNNTFKNRIYAQDDTIKSLTKMTQGQQSEIKHLAKDLSDSTVYFQEKVNEISALEKELQEIIGVFQTRTDIKVEVPISRSGDLYKESLSFSSIKNNVTYGEDVISEQITEQVMRYSSLSKNIENTLDFLDAKPDLRPTSGRLASPFGNRRDPVTGAISFHKGIDLASATGTVIYAAGAGVVTFSGWNSSYGKVVVISHGYGYQSLYAHNSRIDVEVGDHVTKGQAVAKVGSTGKSTGPHVHFEIHYNNTLVDPLTVLKE